MNDPNFVRVPLAVLATTLTALAICLRMPQVSLLVVMAGAMWFSLVLYVSIALIRPQWLSR